LAGAQRLDVVGQHALQEGDAVLADRRDERAEPGRKDRRALTRGTPLAADVAEMCRQLQTLHRLEHRAMGAQCAFEIALHRRDWLSARSRRTAASLASQNG